MTRSLDVIRRATAADAPRIAALWLASRRQFLPYLPTVHPDDDVHRWVREELIVHARVLVSCVEERIVAMLASRRDPEASWILQLYVDPGEVGRGHGTRLLRHALRALPCPVRLYTFQANTGARRFYERHGFRAVRSGDGKDNEERCPDVLYELR